VAGEWKRGALRAIARHRRSRVGRRVGSLGRTFWAAYENDDSNLTTNGEADLLDALRGTELSCAFDVGAFRGDWTAELLARFPLASVHCFEISSESQPRLAERFADDDRVIVNSVGVGAAEGPTQIYLQQGHPEMTSTVRGSEIHDSIPAALTTLDLYASQRALDHVDFVKVDVEGMELDVFKGAHRLLDEARIGIIQFEFTLWSAVQRTWLADLYDFLRPKGFTIGKIYPGYVDFREYRPEHEIFVRANFLAVHESRNDYLERLS
jgi:FkbM family methyltransferase